MKTNPQERERPTLTIATICLNEEDEIAGFIDNFLPIADEIVIIDDGSSDRSAELARAAGPKVKFIVDPRGPDGGFCDQRNKAVRVATSEWILQVDLDMRITARAAEEVLDRIRQPTHDAWRFRLEQYMLNLPARRGGRQYWNQPWLARRRLVSWSQRLHERIQVDTKPSRVGQLSNRLIHINDQTWEERLHKSLRYQLLEADRIDKLGRPVRWWHLLWQPLRTFVTQYFAMSGWRDGTLGLILALHGAFAAFQSYALVWARHHRRDRCDLEADIRARMGSVKEDARWEGVG